MNKWRNRFITVFVILWCLAYHYESVRFFYLQPFTGWLGEQSNIKWAKELRLPKIPFLFPPAGWIMFFNVDNSYGYLRIFGFKGDRVHEIDPHDIFKVRTIGFDNIHRGVIGSAASKRNSRAFCRHLFKHFEYFESFRVHAIYYPDFVTNPYDSYEQVLYVCKE